MPPLAYVRITCPVGPLLAVASERGLSALPFLDPVHEAEDTERFFARLRKWFDGASVPQLVDGSEHPILLATQRWLDDYFAGVFGRRPLPPLDMRGADFERQVWKALLDIPIGTTCSYGDIAKRIGNPGAARAVGLANGANPVPILVPCHRVIGASGALTGYGGGLPRKTWLLDHEQRHWGATRSFEFE